MNIKHLSGWLFLLAAVFIAMPKAHAGVGRDRATGQAVWDAAVNGRTTNIGGAGGSWKVIGPAGGATAGSTAGGAKISGTGKVPVAEKEVPANITGEITKDAIVGGVQGCLTGGIPGCVLGTLTPLALAYVSLSGLRQVPGSDPPVIEKIPAGCYVAPCYEYNVGAVSDEWVRGIDAACPLKIQRWNERYASGATSDKKVLTSISPVNNRCYYTWSNSGGSAYDGLGYRPVAPLSPTWYPTTPQEVKDALYNNNPTPGIVDELARYGNIIWPLGNTTVTGPASIEGPKTVTNKPDGTSIERQERTNYTYDGPNVTKSGTTVTTTTKDAAGNPTGTTTETTTQSPADTDAPKPEEQPPTDTPLPAVPDFYTPKFPSGITGVWNTRKAELMNSPLMTLKDQLLPSLGSGGSCPSFMVDLTFTSWASYGTTNVAPPCWVWDFGKVVVLLSAMFLARALIFGG